MVMCQRGILTSSKEMWSPFMIYLPHAILFQSQETMCLFNSPCISAVCLVKMQWYWRGLASQLTRGGIAVCQFFLGQSHSSVSNYKIWHHSSKWGKTIWWNDPMTHNDWKDPDIITHYSENNSEPKKNRNLCIQKLGWHVCEAWQG